MRSIVLVRLRDMQQMVLHGGHRPRRRVDRMSHRIGDETADQTVDVAVQSRGEQHPLALRGHLVQQRGDLRQETMLSTAAREAGGRVADLRQRAAPWATAVVIARPSSSLEKKNSGPIDRARNFHTGPVTYRVILRQG